MKLSFSTLSCPDWTLDQIIDAAVKSRYDAIDFRGYLDDVEVLDSPYFKGDSLRAVAARIRDAGLEVSGLSSGARMTVATAAARAAELDKMRRYADLCQALGCRQVRIFGGSIKDIADPVANAAETLVQAAEIARSAGVLIAVETHDDWMKTDRLRAALRAAGEPEGIGLLWDLQHPWYFCGEEPEFSAANLSGKICNTHWKDLVRLPGGKYRLCLVGKGELPISRLFAALRSTGYDGWCTLEWEKRWHREIEEPEVAIPAFADFFRSLPSLPASATPS